MKTYVGVDVLIHIFLTSALVGGEWSASRPCFLSPGKSPRYPFYRRLGGPQSRSGRYGEAKIFYSTRTLTPASPGRPARSPSKSSAEVNAWSYTSTPSNIFMAWCLTVSGQLRLTFTFLTNVYDYLAHHILFVVLRNSQISPSPLTALFIVRDHQNHMRAVPQN
jgi:hypothetical protein